MAVDKKTLLRDALKQVQAGKLDKAIETYKAVVKVAPRDATVHNTLGDLYIKQGRKKDAAAEYLEAAELYEKDGFALRSIAICQKLINLDADQVAVRLKLGDLYASQKLPAEARAQYLLAADLYDKKGDVSSALDIFRKIADLDPDNLSVRIKLAGMFEKQKFPEKAAEEYVRAAKGYLDKKEKDAAVQLYVRAFKLAPANIEARRRLADFYAQRQDWSVVVGLLETPVAKGSRDVELLVLYAEAVTKVNHPLDAVKVLQPAQEREPNSVPVNLALGWAYMKAGDVEKGAAALNRCVSAHLAENRLEPAESLLRQMAAAAPDDDKIFLRLLEVSQKRGDNGSIAKAYLQLAAAYEKKGLVRSATGAIEKYLELNPGDAAATQRLEHLKSLAPAPKVEAPLPPSPPPPPSSLPLDEEEEDVVEIDLEEDGLTAVVVGEEEEELILEVEEGLADTLLEEEAATAQRVTPTAEEEEISLDLFGQVPEIEPEHVPGPVLEPIPEVVPELVSELGPGPSPGPLIEPIPKLVPEPLPEPLPDLVPEPMPEPTPELVPEPIPEPVLEPIPEPAGGSAPASNEEVFRELLAEEAPAPSASGAPGPTEPVESAVSADAPQFWEFEDITEPPAGVSTPATVPKSPAATQPEMEEFDLEGFGEAASGSVPQSVVSPPLAATTPPVVPPPVGMTGTTAADTGMVEFEEFLAEADFYFQQGLVDEAEFLYNKLLRLAPGHPVVTAHLRKLEKLHPPPPVVPEVQEVVDLDERLELAFGGDVPAPAWETPQLPAAASGSGPSQSPDGGSADFLDFLSGLRQEFETPAAPVQPPPPAQLGDDGLTEIFKEFQRSVKEQLGDEDFETHYNLGIAYKEMGLMEEAIAEFALAEKHPARRLNAVSMIALCLREMGRFDEAALRLRTGISLAVEGSEDQKGFLYDLASLDEQAGRTVEALETLRRLQTIDPGYRDVAQRVGAAPPPADSAPRKKSKVSYL